jgi:hypothetical protein
VAEQNPYAAPDLGPAGSPPPPPDELRDFVGPRGIGGWLILPILGLVGSAIVIVVGIVTVYLPLFREGGEWAIINDPSFEQYHPAWGPLILFELFSSLGFLVAIGFAFYFLARKSRRFPRLMIGYYIANAAVIVLDLVWAQMVPAVAAAENPDLARELGNAAGGVLIWVPYFLQSLRVKNTFVEP